MTDGQHDVQHDTNVSDAATPKAKPKAKRTNKLPATVKKAAATGQASQLGRAIAATLGMKHMDLKAFRDVLRRRHGYVSGKHGTKLTLTDKVAADMLAYYRERAKRK